MVENENKKSNVVLIIVIIGVVVCFSIVLGILLMIKMLSGSSSYSDEEKAAVNKTITYIEEKYNFTPTIKSVKEDTSYGGLFIHNKNGNYNITCSDGIKTFSIYVGSNSLEDNYQKDEIESDIKNYIEDKIGTRITNISMKYGTSTGEYKSDGLISYYYNSGELKELFKNEPYHISVETIGAKNINNLKYDSTIQEIYQFAIVNYSSRESYNKSNNHDFTNSSSSSDIKEIAPLLKDAYRKDGTSDEYYDIQIKSYDIFKYYSSEGNNSNIKISVTENEDVTNWIGRGACSNIKALTKTYKIENYSDDEILYIYIPKSYIKNANNTDLGIHSGDNFYTESVFESQGDYYPVYVSSSNTEFTIVLLYSKC